MRAFVATRVTQGQRASDFGYCVDGELVWMIDACPLSRLQPDGPCGCGRSYTGMSSGRFTTTAVVREIPGFTRQDYESALRASFETSDWCPCCLGRSVPDIVDELIDLAAVFADGTVVGRRVDTVVVRE